MEKVWAERFRARAISTWRRTLFTRFVGLHYAQLWLNYFPNQINNPLLNPMVSYFIGLLEVTTMMVHIATLVNGLRIWCKGMVNSLLQVLPIMKVVGKQTNIKEMESINGQMAAPTRSRTVEGFLNLKEINPFNQLIQCIRKIPQPWHTCTIYLKQLLTSGGVARWGNARNRHIHWCPWSSMGRTVL